MKKIIKLLNLLLVFSMAATSVIAEESINSAETPINEITENPTEKNTEEKAEDRIENNTSEPANTIEESEQVKPTPEVEIKVEEKAEETIDWDSIRNALDETGTYISETMEIERLGLTEVISKMLNEQSTGRRRRRRATTQRLKALGRVASAAGIVSPIEFITMLELNGLPTYCIEPEVAVDLNEVTFEGHDYEPKTIFDLDRETRKLVGRIMYYGYGHPMTGNDPKDYIATQLLVWQHVGSKYYDKIYNSLNYCGAPKKDATACTLGLQDIPARMDKIMNYVENFDKVPSFADEWHGVTHHQLDWNETLTLHDENGILDWFKSQPEETHKGINIKVEGNDLKVDIDSLYYEGRDTADGKTLTFKRKHKEFEKFYNGILLWETPGKKYQRTMNVARAWDPTPEYKLTFKMNTANVAIKKLDEYGKACNYTVGTKFYVGWYEDPETQYERTGGNDMNWRDIHDPDRIKKDDIDGKSNIEHTTKFFYPIMTEDGSAIRTFEIGADCTVHIDNLLPANKKWWVKEVEATNPYLLDSRSWSVNTGNTDTTTTVAFENALRDVTLSLVKKDQEDKYTKINGATYRIYEIGDDLDLSKDPTALGAEVNLDRFHQPTLTFKQLKEHSRLTVGDTFIFNGFVYEIVKDDVNRYLVKAIKQSEYHLKDSDIYSRYQFYAAPKQKDILGFQPGNNVNPKTKYQVFDIEKRHATYASEDDEISTRNMYISDTRIGDTCINLKDETGKEIAKPTDINPDTQKEYGCIVKVTEDRELNQTFDETTKPSYSDILNAANDAEIKLEEGSIITVDKRDYTIKTVGENSVVATVNRDYMIDLNNTKPSYYDIPNVRSVKRDDEFVLKYPYTMDGKTFVAKQQSFKVVKNDGYELIIETIPEENRAVERFTYQIPNWIEYEDLPEKVDETENYTITKIYHPEYTVEDNRGNIYLVKSNGTELLKKVSEDANVTDIDYLYVIGSYTKDNETGAIVEDASGLHESGCLNPQDVNGCPVDTQRVKTFVKEEVLEFESLQYEDLTEEMKTVEISGTFQYGDTTFKVIEKTEDSMKLGFVHEGKPYVLDIVKGVKTKQAIHRESYEVIFKITDVKEKEFDVLWNTLKVPSNSLTTNQNIHLYKYHGSDLTWKKIPDTKAVSGTKFTDVNGVEYEILFNDLINHKMIVQSYKGRFEVTPEETKEITPIKYEEIIAKEIEEGKTFKVNDEITNMYQKVLEQNDHFTIDGHTYTVLEHQYSQDRDTTTLTNAGEHKYKVVFNWEKNAPLSYDKILQKSGNEFEHDGKQYQLETKQINGETAYVLREKESEEVWHYVVRTIQNEKINLPYEEKQPHFTLEVKKPSELTYEQYENAKLDEKVVGDRFGVDGKTYQVKKIEPIEIGTLENQKVITVLDEADQKELKVFEKQGIEDIEKAPFDFMKYSNAEKLLEVGESFRVNENTYIVLKIEDTAHHGKHLRLKNKQTKAVVEVYENPNSNFYETEKIYYYAVKQIHDLKQTFSEAHHFKLAQENLHITLDGTTIKSDSHTIAKVLLLDENGNTIDVVNLVFTAENPTGTMDALPIFEGVTGKQYMRIMASNNHNMPMPYTTVKLYKDLEFKDFYKEVTSDGNGVVDVSDYPEGTYYYRDVMFPEEEVQFTVIHKDSMQGQLKVNGLKWGRKYLACEVKLPEGYDYGTNEVCKTFTLETPIGKDILNAELDNQLRRLKLKVYKVDSDDHSYLLNGAWFTVSDVTDANLVIDEKEASTFKQRIQLLDIPNDAQVGEKVIVWRAKEHGKSKRYRIVNIAADAITVESFENNKPGRSYNIPIKGVNRNVPMTYQDIVRALPVLKKKAIFLSKEKESPEAIKEYEILALQRVQGTDALGKPTDEMVIGSATVIDISEANHQPIELNAIQSKETYAAQPIGKYVSGGVFTEVTEQTKNIPLGWNELVNKLGGEDKLLEGAKVQINQRRVVPMPKYEDLPVLTKLKSFDELQPNTQFMYQNVHWTIKSVKKIGNHYEFVLSAFDKEYECTSDTVMGSIEYTQVMDMQVVRIYPNAVSLQDEFGNSIYIQKTDEEKMVTVGKPGMLVRVSKTEEMNEVIAVGYTDGNGQLALYGMQDGDYYVERDGAVTKEHVEKGTIALPDVKYGHQIQVCETKSPIGYVIGQSCEVITPKADYTTDLVKNFRANISLRKRRKELKRWIKKWKMGV